MSPPLPSHAQEALALHWWLDKHRLITQLLPFTLMPPIVLVLLQTLEGRQ